MYMYVIHLSYHMKVVILGGGFCGVFIAKKLEKHNDSQVILIDSKSYFEYQPSLHKILKNPKYISKLRVEYHSFLPKTQIIVEKIKRVTSKSVELSDKKITYDILVIGTGIDYPISLENKKDVHILKNGEEALKIAKKIKSAAQVLIVGGGLIGTEVAGEIVTKFPHINLTLVHAHERLLNRLPLDASEYTLQFLSKNNTEIIFGEKVVLHEEGCFYTNKDRKIHADLCVWCAGNKNNPSFMQHFPITCFTKKNALAVTDYLRLYGYENIFVGGDITKINEEKTARKAELHAKLIVKNIKRISKNQPLIPYTSKTSPMVISLGDLTGVIYYKKVIPGLFIPGILKWMIQWWILRQLK